MLTCEPVKLIFAKKLKLICDKKHVLSLIFLRSKISSKKLFQWWCHMRRSPIISFSVNFIIYAILTGSKAGFICTSLRKFDDMISGDMVFEIEHLFWQNTSWSSGEESNQYHGPTGRKNPEWVFSASRSIILIL